MLVQRETGLKVCLKPEVLSRSELSQPEKLLDTWHILRPCSSLLSTQYSSQLETRIGYEKIGPWAMIGKRSQEPQSK